MFVVCCCSLLRVVDCLLFVRCSSCVAIAWCVIAAGCECLMIVVWCCLRSVVVCCCLLLLSPVACVFVVVRYLQIVVCWLLIGVFVRYCSSLYVSCCVLCVV